MGKVGKKRDMYDREGTVIGDDGSNSSSCSDDEADPNYMTFLANAKPDGASYFVKASDQNGLPVFLKYEDEDRSDDEHQCDKELEIHGVEKDQDNVWDKYILRSSKTLKTKARESRSTSIVEKQRSEGRDLDNGENKIDVKKEQESQNGSIFMFAGVQVKPKEDSDSLEEAITEREVEILENAGADAGWGSSYNPFVPSVVHCEDLDGTIIDSGYRKEVLNLLMRPYDEEEYKKLWKDIKMKPYSETNGRGKSLLSLHKAVNRKIKKANHDKDKRLNIMRGFFFWLEHLTREDAFQPWEDAECLQTMPGSS